MTAFADHFTVTIVAETFIAVIAAQNDLSPFYDDLPVVVEPGIDCSLSAAAADRFDFCDRISDLKEPFGPGKELCLEISPKTKAEYRYIIEISKILHLTDLIRRQELTFITDHDIQMMLLILLMEELPDIHLRTDSQCFLKKSDP